MSEVKLPIITCEPTGMIGDAPQWSFWCKFCKTYHRHGGKPDANGVIGHRVAHCHAEASPYRETGYILSTKDLFWQEADRGYSAASLDPVAQYTVREVTKEGRPPRYHAHVLTEAGPAAFGREFRTLQSAKDFCDRDLKDWRSRRDGTAGQRTTL